MGRDSTTKFVGLDVHSKTISVAIADEGREGEVRHYGTIDNTTETIEKVIKSLAVTEVKSCKVLQNFFTRSLVMEAFPQLLPSFGLQSSRMVITRSASR